jgi:hypothetical protein
MKALISPNEPAETGFRVVEVSQSTFEVAEPMFWVDCADDVAADFWWYDPADSQIKQKPDGTVTISLEEAQRLRRATLPSGEMPSTEL